MHCAHLRIMPASRIAPTKHKINQCSLFHRYESFWQDLQNRHNPLPIFPPHLFCQLDACDQVAGAARAEEEPIIEDEEAGHGDSFGVGDPVCKKKFKFELVEEGRRGGRGEEENGDEGLS